LALPIIIIKVNLSFSQGFLCNFYCIKFWHSCFDFFKTAIDNIGGAYEKLLVAFALLKNSLILEVVPGSPIISRDLPQVFFNLEDKGRPERSLLKHMQVEFLQAVPEGDGRKVINGGADLRGEGGGFVSSEILSVDDFASLLPHSTLPSDLSQQLPRLHYIMEELLLSPKYPQSCQISLFVSSSSNKYCELAYKYIFQ
jgi:hypothetical protein